MLGLFLILPVFSVAAVTLTSSTPELIGLALGAYGLTQALLQIPGLSDYYGRKPIITGLILFALGSLAAAHSTSIYGVIFGRALQGGGASQRYLTRLPLTYRAMKAAPNPWRFLAQVSVFHLPSLSYWGQSYTYISA